MILDNKNDLHNALMKDVFEVTQDKVKCCQLDFYSSSETSVSKAKAVIYHILSVLEGISLEINELTMLHKAFLSAANAEIGHSADGFTFVSNGKIARIETLKRSKTYSGIIVTTNTLSNSDYYMQHREEFAETETN